MKPRASAIVRREARNTLFSAKKAAVERIGAAS